MGGALRFIDLVVDNLDLETFYHWHSSWVIISHSPDPVTIDRGAELLSDATHLHALQEAGMWHSDKTTTKLCIHPISVWCSLDLEETLQNRMLSLDTCLTKAGRVGLSNFANWKRELQWTQSGQAYSMGDHVGLGATDGSVANGKEGSGAVWLEPGTLRPPAPSVHTQRADKTSSGRNRGQ